MSEKDYYGALGVKKGASTDEIKKAYRRLAKELHPDRNPGDEKAEERFKEVSEAYGVLSDAEKRALYDEFGVAGLREGFDPEAYRARQAAAAGFDFGEMFGGRARGGGGGGFGFDLEDLFRGAGSRTSPRPGRDYEAKVEVSFLEALRGTEKEVSFTLPRRREVKSLKVRIPAGIRDGEKLRLRGQGGKGARGGSDGDLILSVSVGTHPDLWYEGDTLHMRLPVRPLEAYEGSKVPVSTPGGDVQVKLPKGAKTGAKLGLKGKGAPKRGGPRGKLILHVEVVLPEGRSDALREAYATLDEALSGDPRGVLPKLS
ncbi:MAG TPA: DnaJ C-terminal domain-containing protein [Polyangiaceae bacterium LLY-WYZ-15_(1-7)]|nr:DnaJ C-terminal domain-containing protein [Polyangiaceae bacterium LLY-WYZ-15_(1-7)]HJL03120.1 DnaJ C-terminal domain-containing protein [Polyangiaceae bacterium LLY-WYZ-15_(1-7)]HJL08100.1 DnaJ C-terminal domain-containing protein [Polyangiaceae bacterium LLY-WYZ-15_(1-7)]HJL24032.1 DnaJ C-terminal domain-containing protein [Polyangiaceae bacterium LLY-WYZ-15_(1-7)]HJL33455.1 DnaJ C-terminal domain-containing protein [Polyangiaceae bacterium LLY-WYZ-15_(1-7)]